MLHSLIEIADSISTRPNKTSWCWKGRVSLFSFLTLHLIYVFRLFSLLQWSKFIFRKIKKLTTQTPSVDKASVRINVPSYFVELYYLLWCLCVFILPSDTKAMQWMSAYFMFESFTWLIYYFFFRRFFEEKYAIMHPLEYIIVLPVMIATQVKCISTILQISFSSAFAMLFAPQQDANIYIIILGVIYTALIFGIFLTNLPIEKVKEKGDYKYNISIIGNGEIVQNRLKHALGTHETPLRIAVMDIKEVARETEKEGNARFNYYKINDSAVKRVLSSNIVWIATPSSSHLTYLSKYINTSYIAIEKPLISNKTDLSALLNLYHSNLWNHVFCLGYYYLEKALPLTFLYNPLSFYEKYLEFNQLNREEIVSRFEQLGHVASIELFLLEGADERLWVNSKQNGGQLLETFLHIAVIARMVTGCNSDWGNPDWKITNGAGYYMKNIHCSGEMPERNVKYNLQMGKFMPPNELRRNGTIRYENGEIEVDFDKQEINGISKDGTKLFSIKTKEKYRNVKYSIQLDMVERCYEEGIEPSIIDGSDIQIATLQWLLDQKETMV